MFTAGSSPYNTRHFYSPYMHYADGNQQFRRSGEGEREREREREGERGRERARERDLLVSWYFEPSQPQRITSGLPNSKYNQGKDHSREREREREREGERGREREREREIC